MSVFAWCVVSAGGCATISGLDQIQESECAPHCDGGVTSDDVQTESASDRASPSWFDVNETSPVDVGFDRVVWDSAEGDDAASDGMSQDDAAPPEASTDAKDESDAASRADAKPDVSVTDAGNESETGCGALNTVGNCGSCGTTCAGAGMSVASAGCSGTACTYTCNAGYLDCNASKAPNTDGCECATPGVISATCCSTSCPSPHVTGFPTGQTGLNQTFYDCEIGLGVQVAMDACAAYTGSVANCVTGYCVAADGGTGDSMVCSANAPTCTCWDYQGNLAGLAYDSRLPTCYCPRLGDAPYH